MESAAHSPFPPTRWSVVLKLRGSADSTASRDALGELCASYWYPLYAFARRLGRSAHDAQDLTQGFFAGVVEKNLFASAEREMGKLRTFLLTAFVRYIGSVADREHAQKRGGVHALLALDAGEGEARYAGEPVDLATPERLFERSWAYAILATALAALSAEESAAGRAAQFAALEPFLSLTSKQAADYGGAAAALSLTEPAARQAVSRLRQRFREILRRQIADTLHEPTPAQVDEELASLRAALRG